MTYIQLITILPGRSIATDREGSLLLRSGAIDGMRFAPKGSSDHAPFFDKHEVLVAGKWIHVKEPVTEIQMAIQALEQALKGFTGTFVEACKVVLAAKCSSCGGGVHYDNIANLFSFRHTSTCPEAEKPKAWTESGNNA